jgi:hypothetical protein
MTTAFKCDRCEEYHDGDGADIRVAELLSIPSAFSRDYDIEHECELCEDCKTDIYELVENELA